MNLQPVGWSCLEAAPGSSTARGNAPLCSETNEESIRWFKASSPVERPQARLDVPINVDIARRTGERPDRLPP
jgi:hypothetical protein